MCSFVESGTQSAEDVNAVDEKIAVLSKDRQYSLQFFNVPSVLKDLGLFVESKIQ